MRRFNSSILLTVLVLLASGARGQTARVDGRVTDAATGEPLPGATLLRLDGSALGTASGADGRFEMRLPYGPARLAVSYVGYRPDTLSLTVRRDTSLAIGLRADDAILGTVAVVANGSAAESVQMGELGITAADIRETPVVLGEADPIKVLQLAPGVRGGREGSAGLLVRGGGPGENLVLLDGMPLYGTTHLFGFFSAFPSEAIESVRLLKSGFPSRYAGRLSSVVEIEPRAADPSGGDLRGSVGLLSSQATAAVPLAGGRGSLLLAGRRTYVDLFTRAAQKSDNRLDPYFYDAYGRLDLRLSPLTTLALSGYRSRDDFESTRSYPIAPVGDGEAEIGVVEEAALGWRNGLASAVLRHRTRATFTEVGMGAVRYALSARQRYETTEIIDGETVADGYGLRFGSDVRDARAWAHTDVKWSAGHRSNLGATLTRHRYAPSALRTTSSGAALGDTLGSPPVSTWEAGVYAEHRADVGPLRLSAGAHLAVFGLAASPEAASGETALRTAWSVQPRASARLLLGEGALKASYARTAQPLHLLVSGSVGLPTELWLPATTSTPPSVAEQWSIGGAYEPGGASGPWTLTAEAYLKRQSGVLTYRDGGSFADVSASGWESEVARGRSRSIGLELYGERRWGRWRGRLGYTLSRTTLSFPDLDGGAPFPSRFDRTHDLSATGRYALHPDLSLSATWVYGTGEAATLPQSTYQACVDVPVGVDDASACEVMTAYGPRNGSRLPAYHRLDLALRWGRPDGPVSLSAGVYNAYNRLNPFYVTRNSGVTVETDGTVYDSRYLRSVTLFPALPFARLDVRF